MPSTVITNATTIEHPQGADIVVTDGSVTTVTPAGNTSPPANSDVLDASDCVVLPGLVDAHCHLDKTLWSGPWPTERGGRTLAERIATEQRRGDFALPNVDYATALLEHMVKIGRAHV